MDIEVIIFYFLLLDSIFANIAVWLGSEWYTKRMGAFARHFPASKGWALLYLVLVLWIGFLVR